RRLGNHYLDLVRAAQHSRDAPGESYFGRFFIDQHLHVAGDTQWFSDAVEIAGRKRAVVNTQPGGEESYNTAACGRIGRSVSRAILVERRCNTIPAAAFDEQRRRRFLHTQRRGIDQLQSLPGKVEKVLFGGKAR